MDPAPEPTPQGPPKTPRWVWLLVGLVALVGVAFLALHLVAGGGPSH